jgi:hypothetical protein
MDMMEMLRASGGLDAIAGQLGIPPEMAQAGAGALLPAIVGGFQKQSDAAGGGAGGCSAGLAAQDWQTMCWRLSRPM